MALKQSSPYCASRRLVAEFPSRRSFKLHKVKFMNNGTVQQIRKKNLKPDPLYTRAGSCEQQLASYVPGRELT